jgi:hypothetical protein
MSFAEVGRRVSLGAIIPILFCCNDQSFVNFYFFRIVFPCMLNDLRFDVVGHKAVTAISSSSPH